LSSEEQYPKEKPNPKSRKTNPDPEKQKPKVQNPEKLSSKSKYH
jgi:hypothetical protein